MKETEKNFGVFYDKNDYIGFFGRVVIAFVDLLFIFLIFATVLFISDYCIVDQEVYLSFNSIFFIIFSVWYLALLKRSKYGTIGYKLTGAKIVNLQGEKPSVFIMLLRVFLLLLGPFELVIDIVWLTSEATKQTLRDKYVGTYVVKPDAMPVGKGRLQCVQLGVMGWNLMFREVKMSSTENK